MHAKKRRANILLHDLNHLNEDGSITNLDLDLILEKPGHPRIAFSPSLSTVLVGNKVFSIIQGSFHLKPVSLPLSVPTIDERQNYSDRFSERCLFSACNKYIAIAQDLAGEHNAQDLLEVFSVNFGDASCCMLESIRIETYLKDCIGLKIDFHPYLPKLALALWEVTEHFNCIGRPCEKVKWIIWDLQTNDVTCIGEMLDFNGQWGL